MSVFKIYRDSQGDFRWQLRADNNQIIATCGEGYAAKADCKHAIALIQATAAQAQVRDETVLED